MKLIPFWINAFQAYENLPGPVDLSSAGDVVIKFQFLNMKFKINKDNKKVFQFKEWTIKKGMDVLIYAFFKSLRLL